MMTENYFRELIENGPYAWPGGYPLYFITSDGAALCFESAKYNAELIAHSIADDIDDGWKVIGFEINWEDTELYCDDNGSRIESAYGED